MRVEDDKAAHLFFAAKPEAAAVIQQ